MANGEYDYIIVGSGAGGAPLAARLAEAGKRVLVVEAGPNHAAEATLAPGNEVSRVPGLHAVSTEHPDLSWRFFVKHYEGGADGIPAPALDIPKDPKWHEPDVAMGEGEAHAGIFYPRASGIGGCTIHNAMITIAGPDSDWDELAEYLEDESWSGERMRGYFQKLEFNGYMRSPLRRSGSHLAHTWRYFYDSVRWLFGFTPDMARGHHGFGGWLGTSVADISLGLGDKQLVKMLTAALRQAKVAGLERSWSLVGRFLKGRITQALDPNHRWTQLESPAGLVLIPVAVYGENTTIHEDASRPNEVRGRRSSPRELLLGAQARHPDQLRIETDCLVTELLWSPEGANRVVGVKVQRGARLYKAHQSPSPADGDPDEFTVAPGGEVILCGGAFNTPQLLMLSGIGDFTELKTANIKQLRVNLPGVGRNLQDRYEVAIVSQMPRKFSLLAGATYKLPADSSLPDPHLREWRERGRGLYTSNGAVLGIIKRSRPELAQPDLFIFGIPSKFHGYAVGYSQFDPQEQLFTWLILKSHTGNRGGQVTLRDANPRSTPLINFHSFNSSTVGYDTANDPDVLALVEGIEFVRGILRRAGRSLSDEQHLGMGATAPVGDENIKRWIRQNAWGHHACGTCRMGPEGDPGAVLDARFRVRGVHGLRVVDASIFPKIPGYFIVTNIYMASEKAADVILEDAGPGPGCRVYPDALRDREIDAVEQRHRVLNTLTEANDALPRAGADAPVPAGEKSTHSSSPGYAERTAASVDNPPPPMATSGEADDFETARRNGRWPQDTMGMALSGGGIRSATFCLGILQNMARAQFLRRIDVLSTVSGGGYIGSCLGRFYDRLRPDPQAPAPAGAAVNPVDKVEQEFSDSRSWTMDWLRKHGNYIAPQGVGDGRLNFAIFVRNLLSVHFVVGVALFSLFGLAVGIRYAVIERTYAVVGLAIQKGDLPIGHLIESVLGPFFSPYFVLVEVLLLFLVVPTLVAYWIVSEDEPVKFKGISLSLLFLIVTVLLGVAIRLTAWEPFFIAVSLLMSLWYVELAWIRGARREEALGTGGIENQRLRTRNYLTIDLGMHLAVTGAVLAFTLIDTLAHALQEWKLANNMTYAEIFAGLGVALVTVLPAARLLARALLNRERGPSSAVAQLLLRGMAMGALAVVLFVLPLLFYAFAAYAVYQGGNALMVGLAVTGFTLLLTLLLAHPKALAFVNRSSLAATYAARLARAYLGASNPVRHRPEGFNVTEVVPGDDVPSIRDYEPYKAGGPLHIINVSLNQTVDEISFQRRRDRNGENLAVSSIGVSVGDVWHTAWADSSGIAPAGAGRKVPARLEPLGHPRGTPHPLVDQIDRPADRVEMLSLRQWVGISGGAIDGGRGSKTSVGTALLMGLVNLRTGHWWDTGLSHADRLGFPDITLTRRLLYLAPRFFTTQSLILYEWLAYYPGPWARFWHLSDGGFFENTGAYELVRRRLPRIIVCDGTVDPNYEFDCLAELVRKVRIDFGAKIVPFSAQEIANYVEGRPAAEVVGTEGELHPTPGVAGASRTALKHAALFWVSYDDDCCRSVLLYIKASLTGDEPTDVRQYHAAHEDFPHESTADQFFDEPQWESYRKLGEHLSAPLFGDDWFWRIPVSSEPRPR